MKNPIVRLRQWMDHWMRAFRLKREIKRYDKYLGHQLKHLELKANRTCYKCWGRGHVGFNRNMGIYVPCKCTQMPTKKRFRERLRALGIKNVYTPYTRTTNPDKIRDRKRRAKNNG